MSNDEYQQQQFWDKKEITWVHITDTSGNNWHIVHHPLFDGPIDKEYSNVTKQIIYTNN